MDYDPFFPSIGPAFTAGFRSTDSDLKFDERRMTTWSPATSTKQWDWKHAQPGLNSDNYPQAPNTLPDLASHDDESRVAAPRRAGGRFDLATPAFALKYNLDHPVTPKRASASTNYHDAGHMMYITAAAGGSSERRGLHSRYGSLANRP
jgi:hypothetical protein